MARILRDRDRRVVAGQLGGHVAAGRDSRHDHDDRRARQHVHVGQERPEQRALELQLELTVQLVQADAHGP